MSDQNSSHSENDQTSDNSLFVNLNDSDTPDNYYEASEVDLVNVRKVTKYKELNNRYIKGEKLGKGTFATVRECIDKTSMNRYAIKIMKGQFIRHYRVMNLVELEMSLCHKLSHKNVMKMFESFVRMSGDEHKLVDKLYIIMEYCAGVLTELLEVTADKRLPVWQSHHYFSQLIDGLKYLHSLGIYHRDIKEDNLLLDNSHVIKIADFGVSYIMGEFDDNDLTSKCQGSICYQPPEVHISEAEEPYSGSKFDIWSSGVVLFRMVAGKLPFFENKEDMFALSSYQILDYPEHIEQNRQLLNLFYNIFKTNFRERITIKSIKDHPWLRLEILRDEPRVEFPNRVYGDVYRGMNLLERLRVKYQYAVPPDPTKCEMVTEQEYEESIQPKDPNVRPDRSPIRRQRRQRSTSATRRMVQLGLHRDQ